MEATADGVDRPTLSTRASTLRDTSASGTYPCLLHLIKMHNLFCFFFDCMISFFLMFLPVCPCLPLTVSSSRLSSSKSTNRSVSRPVGWRCVWNVVLIYDSKLITVLGSVILICALRLPVTPCSCRGKRVRWRLSPRLGLSGLQVALCPVNSSAWSFIM